eukprot:3527433-Alexandrium_andersonii.AAC.1
MCIRDRNYRTNTAAIALLVAAEAPEPLYFFQGPRTCRQTTEEQERSRGGAAEGGGGGGGGG